MADPIDNLPPRIRGLVRRIMESEVAGGAALFQKTGDRRGNKGQKAISTVLYNAGIREPNPLWTAVIEHGRALYYGQPPNTTTSTTEPAVAESEIQHSTQAGPAYTQGASFRAQAEAHQRRFRAEVLQAAHGKWGHLLHDHAANTGKNFHHPAALTAAEDRIAAGKGVARDRTFGNMLSSQALCFNLFGPLANTPQGLELAGQLLASFVPSLLHVRTIQLEYTPPFEVFRDQSGLAGVDCDVLIEFEDNRARRSVLVIETKFVETAFSSCGHSKKPTDACPPDVQIGPDFSGCRYVSKNLFLYWQRAAETGSLRMPSVAARGCPFAGPLWQIWVNHTLAHVEAARRGWPSAYFAVCAPKANDALACGPTLDHFRPLATHPSTVLFIPLEDLLLRLSSICDEAHPWHAWASMLQRRYLVSLPHAQHPSARPEKSDHSHT
jgi:hypothetical protein